ncbi:hypothetical protein I5M27_14165 [Adhaeribacter sp. BT258]|uniref:Uncharacterized protein n=1 Tax=Adhaeribacter terrigena TaxID=2793070 RepID=A0ABS1C4M5_9BACT|nr:hypothetical protein [Adhaeribacter terrigena]MBK0404136.1 hypothetical protein [Adhaeribacter terrigena]
MEFQDIIEKAKHELKALQGETGKNKTFQAEQRFFSSETAQNQFAGAIKRLLNINKWSEESGIRATFQLYDNTGLEKKADKPEIGDYFKVLLPGVPLENWMKITDITTSIHLAEFTAHPCANPQENHSEITSHFFVKETSSTFQVKVDGTRIKACQIGLNEKINNHEQAGNRALANTLIAEAGWNGMQFIQWENLAAYWCGAKDKKNH